MNLNKKLNTISEKELLQSVEQARLEYKKRKTIKAKSMADFFGRHDVYKYL